MLDLQTQSHYDAEISTMIPSLFLFIQSFLEETAVAQPYRPGLLRAVAKNVVVNQDSGRRIDSWFEECSANASENPALRKHLMRNVLVTNLVFLRD